ncbi:glycoside hydrolase family 3 C-terminal domain-containing protein [Haloarcula sp. S1AR25-5A]|uniref:Glycoside hydrolase family 3 C-terminal domain-containing protein n=1 Tax=Haloarcula terrestris TaxID=2950533 RepID=A0AAE4EZG0_9EURY|nr:glycoside hydrolase family 3 C-terminal domain-containing protein [Haloarcula terrestris]MDS0223005.1 glycoside hydrolase family 3 C-terminal domain-containing protein [Haloarcula terrestris]
MTDSNKSPSDHRALVETLSLAEKIELVHGSIDPAGKATGYLPGNERVGIPPLRMVDGPLGVRAMGERATAFPSSIALAASWRPDLAHTFGAALGRETAAHDQDVILGPGVNIIRVPQGGRNFEYYSEDPYLTAQLAVGTIRGIQSEDIAATVKHYAANNQETNRYEVSAAVSERALREIYLPAFRAAVEEADVHSVMTAYNCVNGVYMGEHERLLTDVLKDEWGFDGFVVSDWWGTRSTVSAARAGLDIEMPGVEFSEYVPEETADEVTGSDDEGDFPPIPDVPAYFGVPLQEAVESGEVDETVLDAKLLRLLGVMESIGCFTGDDRSADGVLDSADHRQLARDVATEGTIMLTNDGTLPLSESDSIALIGPNADAAKLGGGGSSEVSPVTETSPLAGLKERASDVTFERGVPSIAESSFFDEGDDVPEESDTSIDAAVSIAGDADCAVVVAQDDATEFRDRPDIELPGAQNELIAAVADAAERTVVVLRTSGPIEMPWLDAVDAVLETWYPGQADGAALADVLFGDADPGGRLPVTFGQSVADYPTASEAAFPGSDDVATYDEGVFVGYRYFDRQDTDPLFPFGHGLSYASIEYDAAAVSETATGFEIAVDLTNSSDRAGKEVVQVYVDKEAAPIATPDRELAGFAAVSLGAGESTTVTIQLDADDFEYYDEDAGWTVAEGTNTVSVGRSSRDITARFTLDI